MDIHKLFIIFNNHKNSRESIPIIYNRQGQNLSVDQLIYMPSFNSQ